MRNEIVSGFPVLFFLLGITVSAFQISLNNIWSWFWFIKKSLFQRLVNNTFDWRKTLLYEKYCSGNTFRRILNACDILFSTPFIEIE